MIIHGSNIRMQGPGSNQPITPGRQLAKAKDLALWQHKNDPNPLMSYEYEQKLGVSSLHFAKMVNGYQPVSKEVAAKAMELCNHQQTVQSTRQYLKDQEKKPWVTPTNEQVKYSRMALEANNFPGLLAGDSQPRFHELPPEYSQGGISQAAPPTYSNEASIRVDNHQIAGLNQDDRRDILNDHILLEKHTTRLNDGKSIRPTDNALLDAAGTVLGFQQPTGEFLKNDGRTRYFEQHKGSTRATRDFVFPEGVTSRVGAAFDPKDERSKEFHFLTDRIPNRWNGRVIDGEGVLQERSPQ
jgi:hypothetical protein